MRRPENLDEARRQLALVDQRAALAYKLHAMLSLMLADAGETTLAHLWAECDAEFVKLREAMTRTD